jgi:hypothetical protein
MVRKGLEQAKRFSWERVAMETMEVYKKVDEPTDSLTKPGQLPKVSITKLG